VNDLDIRPGAGQALGDEAVALYGVGAAHQDIQSVCHCYQPCFRFDDTR
jgi:hypothetical protein